MNDFEPALEAAVARSFLAALERDIVDTLLQRAHLRDVPATRIFIDYAQPHRCGLIVSGLARVYTVRLDGAQGTLRRVGPGAAVGIKALLGRQNRVTVQAITDVEFLEINDELLVRLGNEHAPLAMAIAEEIDRRLEDTELQAESNSAGSVIQKVAGALLDLSVEGQPLEVELSQEAMAEMIGASREWVGQELRVLAGDGLIRLDRARITLLEPLHLQEVARGVSARGPRRIRRRDED